MVDIINDLHANLDRSNYGSDVNSFRTPTEWWVGGHVMAIPCWRKIYLGLPR